MRIHPLEAAMDGSVKCGPPVDVLPCAEWDQKTDLTLLNLDIIRKFARVFGLEESAAKAYTASYEAHHSGHANCKLFMEISSFSDRLNGIMYEFNNHLAREGPVSIKWKLYSYAIAIRRLYAEVNPLLEAWALFEFTHSVKIKIGSTKVDAAGITEHVMPTYFSKYPVIEQLYEGFQRLVDAYSYSELPLIVGVCALNYPGFIGNPARLLQGVESTFSPTERAFDLFAAFGAIAEHRLDEPKHPHSQSPEAVRQAIELAQSLSGVSHDPLRKDDIRPYSLFRTIMKERIFDRRKHLKARKQLGLISLLSSSLACEKNGQEYNIYIHPHFKNEEHILINNLASAILACSALVGIRPESCPLEEFSPRLCRKDCIHSFMLPKARKMYEVLYATETPAIETIWKGTKDLYNLQWFSRSGQRQRRMHR